MSIRVLKCTRCRAATQSNLLVPVLNEKLSKRGFKVSDNTCPKCGGASFYDVTPEIAWCWASGLIEWGEGPLPDGAIQIATGPSCDLKRLLGGAGQAWAGRERREAAGARHPRGRWPKGCRGRPWRMAEVVCRAPHEGRELVRDESLIRLRKRPLPRAWCGGFFKRPVKAA